MKAVSFLFLVSLFVSSCGFIRNQPKKMLAKANISQPYDVVIVPGHPYNGESWSTTMNYRVNWSVYLYENGLAKNIIYSGGSVHSKYFEAKIMAKYAMELGIPAEHIFLDTIAEHSTENVYYSYQVAKRNGFNKIALATDPFQNKSLRRFIKNHQLPISELPAVFDTMGTPSKMEPFINAQSAINPNFIALKQRENFFQRLAGTFGKNIIWYEDDLPNEKIALKYEKLERLIRTEYTVENP
jgi:uncharacterized SAM-binding protein YcdF (DUF218 family)